MLSKSEDFVECISSVGNSTFGTNLWLIRVMCCARAPLCPCTVLMRSNSFPLSGPVLIMYLRALASFNSVRLGSRTSTWKRGLLKSFCSSLQKV